MVLAEEIEGDVLELVVDNYNTEFNLIREAGNGDTLAFKTLFDNNVSRVYALCLRMSANVDMAEDLTQEVFIKAWEKLHTFQFQSKFSSWLHSIAVNLFLTQKRSQKRFSQKLLELGNIFHKENPPSPGNYHYETNIDLEKAIAKLPEQAKAAFILHDIEGYKHNEIAEIMNIEIGTSKAHLHRARKILREELEK
jgi:RNA polymerase sigma-70 factor (ECF subfamily)